MDETPIIIPVDNSSLSSRSRFLLLIISSILISFILVVISMTMYNSSGAAQLDLSRPGYQGVRDQVVKSDSDFQNYTSAGPINQTTIDEFQALYDGQAKKIKSVNAFGNDPLSPEALGISATSI